MVKWGLKCEKLLDGFAFMPSHKASNLSGNIQLAEIVLNCEPVKVIQNAYINLWKFLAVWRP